MGDLLNQAGFTLVTLDSDEIVVSYPGIWELMRDIKGNISQFITSLIFQCDHTFVTFYVCYYLR